MIPEIWLCADLQNKSQKRLVEYSGILPVHPGMPPGLPQVESSDDPSGFNVVPGKTSDHIPFLSESWATNLSKHYHFRLAFTSSYYIASMINHTALTLIPIHFEGKGDGIRLAFSNNHGRRKQETVGSHYLAPAPLRKVTKDLGVMVLHGVRQGHAFRAQSLKKKQETCKLLAVDGHQCEEKFGKVCILVPHKQGGCECSPWKVGPDRHVTTFITTIYGDSRYLRLKNTYLPYKWTLTILSPSGFLTMHQLLTNVLYELNTLWKALVLFVVFFGGIWATKSDFFEIYLYGW